MDGCSDTPSVAPSSRLLEYTQARERIECRRNPATRGWRGAPKVRCFSAFNRIALVSLEKDPATRWLGVARVDGGGDDLERRGWVSD